MSEVKIPNSTVKAKTTANTPVPKTVVPGSTSSRAKGLGGGTTVGCGAESMNRQVPMSQVKSWIK
jgi:hypothetical protein